MAVLQVVGLDEIPKFLFFSTEARSCLHTCWLRPLLTDNLNLSLIGTRPSGALARSLKPKACVSMGGRVTKWAPEVKQLPPEGWGPLNKGCERRTWALPDVSGGAERHDRFGFRSRGRGRRATDRGSFRPAGWCRNARTPLLPEPEMAQDALDDRRNVRYACSLSWLLA